MRHVLIAMRCDAMFREHIVVGCLPHFNGKELIWGDY